MGEKMKPFLCTDITTNKKNKTKDGQEFACGCPNEAYSSAYEKICNQLDKMQKDNEKKLLVWMGISFFFTIVWFAIFYYLMEATDWWFDNMFQTKPDINNLDSIFCSFLWNGYCCFKKKWKV